MTYALFVYETHGPFDRLTQEEKQAVYDEYVALSKIPGLVGHRLQPADTAMTVRIKNGEPLTVPGLPAGAMRYLAGFYLLDTEDATHALEIAARVPAARLGGAIQVQPLVSEG